GGNTPIIRNIFLMQSFSVILKGLFCGNLIGLGLLFIQYSTGLLTLDQSQYFLAEVPVEFNPIHILLLNGITLLAVWSMLLLPSMIIANISPDKSIRFQ
ncbi:MAG: ABC transporter permease, partial [Bacteroidales bacterium]